MKFGCCGNLVATGPDKTGIEIIETIAALGYDYIELPLAEMMALPKEEFNNLKKRVENAGVSCEVCNNFFPASIRLTGPDVNKAQIEEYVKAALERAEELGISNLVFGSGGAKNVPEGFPMVAAMQQVVETTELIAPLAQQHNIVIVIEPIRKPECNIINTFAEGVACAKTVNHPNIKVLVDYYHMVWEKEPVQILEEYGPEYLRHVHFAYPNIPSEIGRIYPSSNQEWPYGEFIDTLKKIGYNSRISIEAGVYPDFDTQAKQAISFLKSNFN